MTALALHTALSIALIAWGYMIASRVPYRPALVWAGVVPLVLLGYLSLVARSVFDGSPATVQAIVGNAAATLLALAGIGCLVMFAAVSRLATQPVAARGAAGAAASAWAPRDEDSVIVPEGAEDWDSGSVIDAGSSPSGLSVEEEPHPGRYEYAAPETNTPRRVAPAPFTPPEPAVVPPPFARLAVSVSTAPAPAVVPAPSVPSAVPVSTTPARAIAPPPASPAPTAARSSVPARAMAPPPIEPTATAVYTPVAPSRVAASEWPQASSAGEDPSEHQIAPRRALPPSDEGDDF